MQSGCGLWFHKAVAALFLAILFYNAKESKMFNEVSNILKPLHARRIVVMLINAVYILMALLPPFLIAMLIDDLYPYSSESYAHWFIIGTIAGVLLVCFFLDWLQKYLWVDLVNRGAGIVRSFFFANVLHKHYKFFQEHSVGDINNKVINDSYIYVQSRLMMMPTLCLNILHIVVIFGFLLYLNVYMKLMVVVFSLVFFVAYSQINKHLRRNAVKEREDFSTLMSEANEVLTGVNTIQLYSAESYTAEHFEKSVDAYERSLGKLKFWQTLSKSSIDTITSIVPVAAIVAGVLYLAVGGNITVGSIVAFYYFLPRLKEPVKALADFNLDLQNAKAVEKRLEELLSNETDELAHLEKITTIDGLEFKNLGFGYPDGEMVLSGLNTELVRSDSLAIVGPSGTGKSTLMRLLMHQVVPSEGEIKINGKNSVGVDPASYISRIAVLPQDVFIFDSTIHDNICFGQEYPEKRVRDAATLSAIDHFSMDENALGLSGGERQRVGLARALARDYDVLILDEPTSELDHKTESTIIANLKEVQRDNNCIMIVITHSDNVLKHLCTKRLDLLKH